MDREMMERAVRFTRAYVEGDFVRNPVTIQQKLAHVKIFGVTDLMTRCTDKLGVKEYAAEKLGFDPCPKTLRVYDSPDDVRLSELPERFVLKCSHGCGYNIVFDGKAAVPENEARRRLSKWLSENYAEVGYELQYDAIRRQCFAEEYVGGMSGVKDYKFSCFNGVPTLCQVVSGRGTQLQHMNYYDMGFNYLDVCRLDFRNNRDMIDGKPASFDKMKEYAQALSKPFDYVRCDFYEKEGRVYLGELTFTPGNARMKYKGDPETSFLLGAMLTLAK